jgi:general stress protein YciG
METPKEYHYTYYSYEEWGRGYFGSRTCRCLPEEDVKYFGSFTDKIFKPTQKIILKDDYSTRAEADADEVLLHDYFEVDINPHFANRARQTSSKFRLPRERAVEIGRKNALKLFNEGRGCCFMDAEKRSEVSRKTGKIVGDENRELNRGVCGRSKEKIIEDARKGGRISAENHMKNGTGIFSLTEEQRKENSRKGGLLIGPKIGKENVELQRGFFAMSKEERRQFAKNGGIKNRDEGLGIFSLTKEQRSEYGKESGRRNYELGIGVHSLTPEQKREAGKKGGEKTSSQRWQCTVTGYITTPGALSLYQKPRGIGTSNRIRIS